jgi:hypothetical protein
MAGVDIGERRLALLLQSVLEQLDAESARRTAWEERVVAYLRDVNVVVGRLCRAFPFLSPPMRVPTTDGKSEP